MSISPAVARILGAALLVGCFGVAAQPPVASDEQPVLRDAEFGVGPREDVRPLIGTLVSDPLASDMAEPVAELGCLRYTGSRISAVESRRMARAERRQGVDGQPPCNRLLPGRAYTREDIERTGSIDLAEALRRLDPAVR